MVWLCRPGDEPNPCRETLETTIYEADGSSRVENPPLPADPPIDCFYVYPTVSEPAGRPTPNKDKDDELIAIARYQAARFSQQCRVFAPVYRQLTLASIYTGSAEQRAAGRQARLRRRARGVAGVPRARQRRPRRRADRPLPGHADAAPARARGDRPEPGGAEPPRLGAAARRQRARSQGETRSRRLRERPGLPERRPDGLRRSPTPPSTRRPRATRASGARRRPTPAARASLPDRTTRCSAPTPRRSRPTRRPRSRRTSAASRSRATIGAALIVMYGGLPPSAPTPWLQPADRYTGSCESEDGANFLLIEPIGSARRLNPSPDAELGPAPRGREPRAGRARGGRGVAGAGVSRSAKRPTVSPPAEGSSLPASARSA